MKKEIQITLDYLTRNIPDALNLFKDKHENAFLGVAACSVIEFLGRCLRNPSSDEKNPGRKNFREFITVYLSKINTNYAKYYDLIYSDLRHGAAHGILSKGSVTLSFQSGCENFHFTFVKYKGLAGTENKALFLHSQTLIEDIRVSLSKFVEDLKRDQDLLANYIYTLLAIEKEGQSEFKKYINETEIPNSLPLMTGDIKA